MLDMNLLKGLKWTRMFNRTQYGVAASLPSSLKHQDITKAMLMRKLNSINKMDKENKKKTSSAICLLSCFSFYLLFLIYSHTFHSKKKILVFIKHYTLHNIYDYCETCARAGSF